MSSSSSPFETARKLYEEKVKNLQDEEGGEAKKQSPLLSPPTMTRESPWKSLKLTPPSFKTKLTPSKRSPEDSEERKSPFATLANRTHRKVFSTKMFVAKKLKRFQKDSPSSPSRRAVPPKEAFHSSEASVVDLCSSDEEESVQGKTPPSNEEKKQAPDSKPAALESTTNAATPPTEECALKKALDGALDAPVAKPGSNDSKLFAIENKISPSVETADCSMNGKRMSWKECALKLQEQRKTNSGNEIPPTSKPDKCISPTPSHEMKKPYQCRAKFSIDRMRLLLDVLAPASLSPEALKAESWMTADAASVLKTFSERFGKLNDWVLAQLAKGDFLVPEGMVSVKETLRAYRLSRANATKPFKATKPFEPTPNTVNEETQEENAEEGSTEKASGEESSSETVKATNGSFAWDGTFSLRPKDRSVDNSSTIVDIANAPSEDNLELTCGAESKSTSDSGVPDEERPKDESSNDFEGTMEEESTGNDEPETPCEEEEHSKENEKAIIAVSELKTPDNVVTDPNGASVEFQPESAPEDTMEILAPTQPCEEDVPVTAPKESENSVKSSIIEYTGDEANSEDQQLQLSSFRDVRVIIGEVMKNIVDTVTNHGQQEQDHQPEEIEIDDTHHEPLSLEGLSEDIQEEEEGDQNEKKGPLITVSAKQLILLALPLICLAGIVRMLGLFDVSNSILEGCFRTFIQLHILGSLLSPIFKYGGNHPTLVVCYALFMTVLASYEASSRTKYTYDGQFTVIVQSLVITVAWVAMWAFGAILKPRPIWNPRYLLPIVGMLLGNSINGISITMDTITTSLIEKQSEVDLYLSFGADQYEAVSGIVAHAIQKGATPSLNMMCVVGIVSIPGMMTGQILGGSSPMVAARYQAMIIFLIALTTLSTILVSSCLTVMSAFCSHQILRPDKFVKNRKRGLARLILWAWGYLFGSGKDVAPIGSNIISGGLLAEEGLEKVILSPTTGFEIRSLKRGSVVLDGEGYNSLMQVSGLNRYFGLGDGSEVSPRVLFNDLSFLVNEGDLLLVSGPSGTGKSQLLRMMAGLSPLQEGNLWLQGESWKDGYSGNNSVEWRRQVRYVTQSKVQIPGTPLQFMTKIQHFRSWKADNEFAFMKHVVHHLRQWGMGIESLKKEWAVLSGGESQRVLMAIALASRPRILLFDESTSALDHESKLAVETSVRDYVEDHQGGVLWVSHDEQQAERMAIGTDDIH